MKQRKILYILVSVVVVAGCTTPEFDQARYECEQVALQKYPPIYRNVVQRKSESVQVPDGNVTCNTTYIESGGTVGRPMYRAETRCTEGTKYETRYYNETVTIDVNERARSDLTYACTFDLCMRRYGNRMCEGVSSKSDTTIYTMECGASIDCPVGQSCRSKPGGGTMCK